MPSTIYVQISASAQTKGDLKSPMTPVSRDLDLGSGQTKALAGRTETLLSSISTHNSKRQFSSRCYSPTDNDSGEMR